SFVLFPGSHRILETMAREGLLADLLASGALISEPTCGACAGIGHVPAAGTKSLRAFNRNFPGRSGVKGDEVYLCSSVTAAASALTGAITDPRTAGAPASLYLPESFAASSAGLVTPDGTGDVVRGPNIKSVPLGEPVAEALDAPVLLKLGDKVSTDDISPAGAAVLVFRSNIPAIAEFCFKYVDPEFAARARAAGSGIVVAGELYGQGSSREAAAIGPMYLGVRAVLAKSFARIHRANLINWGVVPLTFDDPSAYDALERDDRLRLDGLRAALASGDRVSVLDTRRGRRFSASCVLTTRDQALGELGLVAAVEVVGTEVTVVDVVFEHVVGGGQHGGGDGEDGLLGASTALDPQELGSEVGVLFPGGRPRGLHESGLQPGITRPRPIREALDRKSTRLNSSHVSSSYAVFGLKKKSDRGLGQGARS